MTITPHNLREMLGHTVEIVILTGPFRQADLCRALGAEHAFLFWQAAVETNQPTIAADHTMARHLRRVGISV